jgi:hypothetical protein
MVSFSNDDEGNKNADMMIQVVVVPVIPVLSRSQCWLQIRVRRRCVQLTPRWAKSVLFET